MIVVKIQTPEGELERYFNSIEEWEIEKKKIELMSGQNFPEPTIGQEIHPEKNSLS